MLHHSTTFLEAISLIFGYIYMGCWSLSFYPQPLLNWKRKSTSGVNIDFFVINVLGFVAYLIYCYAARYSDTFRREYALRHHGLTPLVPFNDLLFAAHAVVLTTIALTQFLFPSMWGFEIRRKGALGVRVSKAIQGFMVGCVLSVAIIAVLVVARNDPDPTTGWAFIDVIYTISYVKLVITIVKYMPQVLTNYRNSSTNGWSIFQILLDFTGGVLSNAQLGLDSYNQGDWSGITGNIVKLGLGNVSIFFDVIFIVQHYWLYAHSRDKDVEGEIDPLLEGDDIVREERIE